MAEEFKGRTVGGEGKVAETDGAYFGGYVRPANYRAHRRDRRKLANQSGKRQSVIIVRERNGRSLAAVFRSESAALSWIKSKVARGTILNADEAAGWDKLNARFEMRRINHEEAYSDGEACTNGRSPISAGCTVAKWAISTMSAARIFSGTLRKQAGVKMRGASITAHNCVASRNWRYIAAHQWISAGTISGTSRQHKDIKKS